MEREIEQYFVWTVQRLGGVTYKFRALNCKGVSDRIACLPGGATWFVELKAPNGRLSPLQRKFAEDMKRLIQNYACLWNKSEIDEWILGLTKTTP
ncbi:MAG: VRR-NUC domain-containing protein [Euryarchaeota archaeon]|nr:VRR-NUC domain-containing protein [Euryarchaeota archaeon]